MPSHLNLPGVVVSVITGGLALTEHIDNEHEDHGDTVTRYLRAESDTPFGIRIIIQPEMILAFQGDALTFEVAIEGQPVAAHAVFRDHVPLQGYQYLIPGRHSGGGVMEPFQFSKLKIDVFPMEADDDDARAVDAQRIKELGNITVTARHAMLGPPIHPLHAAQVAQVAYPGLEPVEAVTEKDAKGLFVSHSAVLGAPVQAASMSLNRWVQTLGPPGTYAVRYVFFFRSKQMLQSLQLIQRTPSIERFKNMPQHEIKRMANEQKENLLLKLQAALAPADDEESGGEDRGATGGG